MEDFPYIRSHAVDRIEVEYAASIFTNLKTHVSVISDETRGTA